MNKKPSNQALKSKPSRIALEQRIVFDAALPIVAADFVDTSQPTSDTLIAESAKSNDVNALGTSIQKNADEAPQQQNTTAESPFAERTLIEGTFAPSNLTAKEIIFIDTVVSDIQQYIADRPNADVVLIDSTKDGLGQIAAALAGRTGIEAIHIISHGTSGELTLGNGVFNISNINSGSHAADLAVIQSALTADGDILIYGCDVAAGEKGQAFINAFANATLADIAASTNTTGHVDGEGNWLLEAKTGSIEASAIVAEDWRHVLIDTDGDLIDNAVDIDDDNDGILDNVENPALDGTIDATWALNNFTPAGVVNDSAMITNVTAFTKGPAIGNASPEFTSSGWFFPGISPFGGVPSTLTGPNGSIAENVYVQTTFTTTAAAAGKVIERIGSANGLTEYQWAVAISSDNFATSKLILDAPTEGQYLTTGTFVLQGSTTYTIRVYFYNKTAPISIGGNMRFNDFKFGLGNLRDTDQDDIINSLDLDSDNDGISDLEESTGGTGVALKDLNNDGTITLAGDGATSMVDVTANGLMDIFGAAGTGTSAINTDGDSRKDFLDLDSDNDGIADAVESRATSGYISAGLLSNNNDLDNDGIVGRYDTTNGAGGAFGGNFGNPVDTDGDGKLDYIDTDSDNDGVLDADESGLSTVTTDANNDGIRDSVGASYSDPDGIFTGTSPNRPIDLLLNEAGDTSQVAYREVNVAPVAVDDLTLTTREEVALVLNLLANDTDANLDVLSLRSINGELLTGAAQTITLTNAVISVTAAGVATFTPNPNFVGTVSFNYEVKDPKGLFDAGAVTINVTPVNDAPTAADKVITINEDTPYTVTLADLGFADATDAPSPNSLLNLLVVAIPNAADGVFTINGAALVINGAISAADIAAGKLIFTPAANKNGNGLGTLSFKVQDNGGTANGGDNTSAASYTLSFNITPVDDVPTISLATASDTGASSVDRITQDSAPTFNGTGAPGDTINLYGSDGVTVLGTAVVAGDGTWSITSTTLTDGVQNLSVKATDANGNEGAAATISVTIDTTPVSPLTVVIRSDTDDSGFITPADGYSQAATTVSVRVSLPTTGNLATVGDSIVVTDNNGNTRNIVLSAAQITAGFVDVTLPKPAEDTVLNVSATLTDKSGNAGTAATDSATLNMLPPGTPTAEIVLDSNNDGFINATEKAAATSTDVEITLPTVNPAQSGYTLRLYAADGTTLLGTRTLDAADIAAGTFTFTGIALPAEGASLTVKARLTDLANIDDAGWQAGTPGNDIAAVDTTLPTIAITSGASILNNASNTTTVTFTLSEASTDFTLADVTLTGGGGLSNFAGSGTTYTATYTAPANTDATVTIAVANTKFTDVALNANADGADADNTLSLTVDTQLPVQPATPTLTNDTGVSATDNIINQNLPAFTIAPPAAGETPTLVIDGVVVAATFDPITNTLTPQLPLSDGPHTVAIRIVDAAGNPSPTSTTLSVTVDTSTPVGVAVTSLEGSTINIAKASDGLSVEVTLPVGAAVGDKVSVSIDGSTSVDRILTAADVSNGKITVVLPQADLTAAGAGPADVSVTYSDVAGNTASPAPLNLLLDLIQPSVIVTPVGDGNLTKAEATDPSGVATVNSENSSTSVITFVGPNGTVTKTINNNGSALPVTLTEAELATLGDGTVTIKIATTDAAGNVTNSPDRTFVLDTVIPTAPVNTTPPATNDATPSITGAGANPGDTITLFAPDGSTLGTATVAPDGTWSITPTLAEGSYALTVRATDSAGNQSPATAVPLTVDLTQPAVTSATLVGDANKTAAEATSASGVWAVNGEAGTTSVVTLTGPNGTVTKTIVNDGTSKPVVLTAADLATLGNGTVNIATVTSDAAGNTTTSAGGSFVLDTIAPTVTVSPVGDANKTAAEATSASGVLTVNGEAGTTSVVTFTGPNGSVTKTVTNNGSPQPVVLTSADLIALGNGNVTVSTVTSDTAGNTTTRTDGGFALDTIAPAAITVTIVSDTNNDTFITESADGFTQADTEVVVQVNLPSTGSQAVAGDTVVISDSEGNTRTVIISAAQAAARAVIVNLPKPPEDTLYTVTATLTDIAGNATSAATDSATLDMLAPGTPAVEIVLDTNNDGLINASEKGNATTTNVKIILPTGNPAQAGYTLRLLADDGTTVLDTRILDADDINLGTYTFTGITLPAEGATLSVKASLTDLANLVDADTLAGTPSNDSAKVDTALPTIAITSANNALNNTTTSTTVTFTLSKPSTNFAFDDVTVTGGGTLTNFAGSGTTYTATYTAPSNTDATITIAVASNAFTDAALNANADGAEPNNTLSITVDNVIPTPPADISTSFGPGDLTNDSTPTFTGSGNPGDTITLYAPDGTTVLGTAIVAADGTWSLTPTAALPEGSQTLTVTASDPAGNQGPATSIPVNVDTTPPVAPTNVVAPTLTNSNTPAISGTGNPGDTINLYAPDGTTVLGTTTVAPDGTWNIIPNTALAEGSQTISVKATDPAGNEGAATNITLTVDLTAPVAPTSTTPANTNDTTPTITGSGNPGDTITLFGPDGTTVLGTAIVAGDGSWNITPSTALPLGNNSLSVKATDPAGNQGLATAIPVNIDQTPPVAPTVDATSSQPTQDVTPEVTGTGNPGDTITLYGPDGTTPLGTTTVAPDGTWSISPSTDLPEGPSNLSVKATDPAGNEGAASSVTVTVDQTAPLAPTSTTPAATNDTTPTITGTGNPGDTITLFGTDGTTPLGTTTVAPDGTWSVTPTTALPLGDSALSVKATDPAGNQGPATSIPVTVDQTAPVAPTSTTPAATNDTTPTITGTGNPGDTITLFGPDGTTVLGTTTVAPDGTWSVTPTTALPLGDSALSVKATDPAGNQGPATSIPVTVDQTAPVAPTSTTPAATNDTTPTITGTGNPGDTITLFGPDGTTVLGTTTVAPDGTWSVTPTTALPLGDSALSVKATDPAGNQGPATSIPVTVDQTAPVAPTSTTPAATNDTTPTITGTGNPGDTITLFGPDGTTVLGTTTVAPDGTWSVTPTTALPLGDSALSVRATDPAGNQGPATSIPVTVDQTAPVAPTSTTPAATNDTTPTITGTGNPGDTITLFGPDGTTVLGTTTVAPDGTWSVTPTTALPLGDSALSVRATDPAGNQGPATSIPVTVDQTAPVAPTSTTPAATNDTTPTITGTGNPGDTITLFGPDGTTVLGTTTVAPDGTWSVTPTTALPLGDSALSVKATDPAGNQGPATSIPVTVDQTAPVAPTSTTPAATNDTTPTITGTGNPGDTITLFGPDGTTVLGTTTVAPDGTWSVTPTTALPLGDSALSVRATDPAGNQGPATSIPVTVDQTAPVAPTSTTPAATNDTTPTITGTGNPGDTITLFGPDGTTVLGTTTVAPDGTWSVTPTTALPLGDSALSVRATDPAGNQGPATSIPVTVDQTAPVAPTSTTPAATNDTTPTITGTGNPGDTITLFGPDGTTVLGTTTVAPDGTWSVTPTTALPLGDSALSVRATDPAGNQGPATSIAVTVDQTAPTVTSTPVGDSNKSTADATSPAGVLTINGETGSTSVVTFTGPNGTVTKTIVNDGTNKPVVLTTADLAALGDGNVTAATVTTDAAGNTTSTNSGSFGLDTVPPTVTSTPVGDGNKSTAEASSPAGVLSINGETGSTSVVTFTGPNGTVTKTIVNDGTNKPVVLTTADLFTLGDGNVTADTVTTDAAGNTTSTNSGSFDLDTAPPTLTVTLLGDNSKTLAEATSGAGVLTVNGESGATSVVTFTGPNGSVTINLSNTGSPQAVTLTPAQLAQLGDGNITVSTVTTDTSGNTTTRSDGGFVLDTSTPGAPAVTITSDVNNDGVITQLLDGYAQTTTIVGVRVDLPTTGNLAVAGDSVVVTDNYGNTRTVVLSAANISAGFVTVTLPKPVEDTSITVTASLTDVAGNTNPTLATDTAKLDMLPPGTPTVEIMLDANNDGVISAAEKGSANVTDIKVNLPQPQAGDTFSPSEVGDTVTIYMADGITELATRTLDASDITNKFYVFNGIALPVEGTNLLVKARLNDGVLNDPGWVAGTPGNDIAKLDTSSPTIAITSSATTLNTITTSTTVTFTLSEDSTDFTLSDIDVTGGGVLNNFAGSGKVYTATYTPPSNTDSTVTIAVANGKFTDIGLNANLDGADANNTLSLDVDNIQPTVISSIVGDSNKSTAEALDPAGVLTINSETGSTSVVTFTGPNGTVTKTITNDGTNKPVVLTVADLAILGDGTVTASTVTTDAIGNKTTTDSGSFNLDTQPPLAPISTTPAITNDTTPTITGTGNPGETITLFGADGTTVLGTTTVAPDGTWSITPTTDLPVGSSSLSVKATDPEGNVGPATSITVTVDLTPPSAPVNTTSSIPTSDTTPAITGTGNPGDTVTLLGPDGITVLGTTTVAPDGTWSVSPTNPLPEGLNNLSVKTTDPAGNVGPVTQVAVTIDTLPPSAPSAKPSLVGASPTGNTNDSTPSFAVPPPAAGETPNLYINGVKVPATYDPVTQTLTPINPLPEGSYVVTTSVTDAAGNESPQSAAISFKIEEESLGLPEQLMSPPIKFADSSQTNAFNNGNGIFGSGLASNASGIAYVLQSVQVSQNIVAQSNGLGMMNADGPSMAEVNNYNGDLIVTATQDLYIENPRATNFVENAVHHAPISPLVNALVQTSVRQSQLESLARNAGIASFNSASNGVIDLLDPFNVGSPNSALESIAVAQNEPSEAKLAQRDMNAIVTLNGLNQTMDKVSSEKAWSKTSEKSASKLAVNQHLIALAKVAPTKVAAAGFAKQVQASALNSKAKIWVN